MFTLLQGRFTIAAKHHITIAEIYESETIDIDKVRLILNSFTSISWSTLYLPGRKDYVFNLVAVNKALWAGCWLLQRWRIKQVRNCGLPCSSSFLPLYQLAFEIKVHTFLVCSSANKCLLKVAQYASQQEQYEKAIEIYEAVSCNSTVCYTFT